MKSLTNTFEKEFKPLWAEILKYGIRTKNNEYVDVTRIELEMYKNRVGIKRDLKTLITHLMNYKLIENKVNEKIRIFRKGKKTSIIRFNIRNSEDFVWEDDLNDPDFRSTRSL